MDVEKIVLFLDPGAPWLGRFKKLALLIFLFGLRPMLGWRAKGSLNGNRRLLKDQGLLPHHVFGSMQFFHELHPNKVLSDSDVVFDLRIPEESQIWVDEVWREQDLGSCLVIAVALGSIQPHKRWPLEKYIELCQELLADEPSRRFLLVGTPADRLLAGHFLACVGKAGIDLVGKTSISQLAALLKRCSLLIGNDGGAMHLGDAVGCKVVSIVPGIEYPDSIEPWKNREYAVRHEVDCAPCYNFLECPLGHNKCMTELPLSAVLESCRKQLQP
jgi:heptosyltransferase-2